MLGVTTIDPATGARTFTPLCEVCFDERDEPATTERDGIRCCQECGESWDWSERDREAAAQHEHRCPCGVLVDDPAFDALCEEQMRLEGVTACVMREAWCDAHLDA